MLSSRKKNKKREKKKEKKKEKEKQRLDIQNIKKEKRK